MDSSPLHTKLPFPFNVGLPSNDWVWNPEPTQLRVGTLAAIGVSALLGLLSLYTLFLNPDWKRRKPWLRRSQSILVVALSGLWVFELVAFVSFLRNLVASLVDSGLAKLRITIEALREELEFLGVWGTWAVVSATVALLLVYAARTSQVASSATPPVRVYKLPSHVLLATFCAASLVTASLFFGAALRDFVPRQVMSLYVYLDAFEPGHTSIHNVERLRHAYRLAVVLVLIAAVGFWFAERLRARHIAPSRLRCWTARGYTFICALLVLVLTLFTQPLAAEHENPIPRDHAFVNLTLSFPPPLSWLRGIGPDEAYFGGDNTLRLGIGDASRHILPEAKNPIEIYQKLRNEREARLMFGHHYASGKEGFDVSFDDRMSPQQMREWLAALYFADEISHLSLVMSDVVELNRPVLGKVLGVKWTAARFEVRASARDCEQVRGLAIDLTWPGTESTSSILWRIVEQRRENYTACVVVGNRTCLSVEPPRHDCWNRFSAPMRVLKSSQPGDALRALRVAIEKAEFDVVEVEDFDQMRFIASGGQTLADVRVDLEKQFCRVPLVMNGGMFEPSYAPVGLFISGNAVLEPLNERDGQGNFYMKPNGVFSIGSMGARIASGDDAHRLFGGLRARSISDPNFAGKATQSGPIVLYQGCEHPEFDPNSSSRAIRNAVGVKNVDAERTRVLFAISNTPVTFHELARLFTLLGYPNALYLDGRVSRMDFPAFGRTANNQKFGPVLAVADCPGDS
jgi:uncharacterized protein YigE (DUF2233 family)